MLKCFLGLQCSHLKQHLLQEGIISPSFGSSCSLSPLLTHDLINFVFIHSVKILHILLVNTSQYFFVTVNSIRFHYSNVSLLKWSFRCTD